MKRNREHTTKTHLKQIHFQKQMVYILKFKWYTKNSKPHIPCVRNIYAVFFNNFFDLITENTGLFRYAFRSFRCKC